MRILGYVHTLDYELIKEAVEAGVTTLIWFQISLLAVGGKPTISTSLDLEKLGRIASQFDVEHFICVGGWNAPHIDTTPTALEIFDAFHEWNKELKHHGFNGFTGIDWDLEGHDVPSSPTSQITLKCLDYIGEISMLAKKNGYMVSLAPAESYLDPTTSKFDLNLNHSSPEYEFEFPYHGWNTYAYLVKFYDVFDFVMVQYYESYSHVLYHARILDEDLAEYLLGNIKAYEKGWTVDFSSIVKGEEVVKVETSRIVIGLANGWADGKKTIFMNEEELEATAELLHRENVPFGGFGFWNIGDEGQRGIYLAKILGSIVRKQRTPLHLQLI